MEEYQCELCNKSFYRKRYLSDHLKRTHNKNKEKESDIEVKCDVCGKTFANKKTESSHRIRIHGHHNQKLKKTMFCQEENCNESFPLLSYLRNHLKEAHHNYDGLDRCEEIEFECFEDFMQWLATEERNSKSHFILNRGSKRFTPNSTAYYVCSRSGVFNLSSEGKRQLKAQGTKKIGYNCTAQIIVVMKEKSVSVKYYRQHYKHDNDAQHAPIPDEVKKTIASKLVQGVNDKRILEDIRSSSDKKITQKDINNVKALIGQSNLPDDVGLKIWVHPMGTTYSGKLFAAPKVNSPPSDVFDVSNSKQSINKETVVDKIYELYLKAKEKAAIDEVVGKKIIDSVNIINTLLDIPTNQNNLPVAVLKEPSNKKITRQKRFFSTKKTKAKKRKLSKPSTHESDNIKRALLNLPIISRNPLNDHDYT